MVQCTNCLRVFRNNWTLDRHLTRITPCLSHPDSTLDTQKATLNTQKATLNTQKATLDTQKATLDTQKATCKYCKEYSSSINLKRHEQTCKFKDDQVRQLEINLGISPKGTPDCKTECRYCNKNLSKVYLLNRHSFNCEAKECYRQELMNPPKTGNTIINNGIINNSITNNVTNIIVIMKPEYTDHLTVEQSLKYLSAVKKDNPGADVYGMAQEYILYYDDFINEDPRNCNVIIPNIKSSYGEMKTSGGWIKKSVTKCLDSSLKCTAKLLTDKRDSMELQVGGFKSDITKGIFSEVKQFASKGLRHSTHGSRDLNEFKTSLKINKLRKNHGVI